jgi:hypothetical protein
MTARFGFTKRIVHDPEKAAFEREPDEEETRSAPLIPPGKAPRTH